MFLYKWQTISSNDGPKLESQVVLEQWLQDFKISNNYNAPTTAARSHSNRLDQDHNPSTTGENDDFDGSCQQLETDDILLSPSTFAWRFEDKSLSQKQVKVDNFFSAENIEENLTIPLSGKIISSSTLISSYIPSGLVLDVSISIFCSQNDLRYVYVNFFA